MEPVFLVYNRIGPLRRLTVQKIKNFSDEPILDVGTIQDVFREFYKTDKNMVIILELPAGQSVLEELDFVKRMSFRVPIIVTMPVVDQQYILQFHEAGARKILLKTLDSSKFVINLRKTLNEFKYTAIAA